MDFLVALNQRLQHEHSLRDPDGAGRAVERGNADARQRIVPRHRLAAGRDLPPSGLAARFVSGYLIQFKPDVKPLEGPSVPKRTSPICTPGPKCICRARDGSASIPLRDCSPGEGHIPLAATPEASLGRAGHRAASTNARSTFEHEMRVTRIHEDPRVTLPYTDQQWDAIEALGCAIDRESDRRRHPPHHGRRADLRLDRRHGRRRMEHRGAGPGKTRLWRAASGPLARPLRARRLAALRPGQMVSGRAAAALGAGLLLAHGRRAAVARSCAARARRRRLRVRSRSTRSASRKRWRGGWASIRNT